VTIGPSHTEALARQRDGQMPPRTSVETLSSPDTHGVRTLVDPRQPQLFRFRPEIVKGAEGLPGPTATRSADLRTEGKEVLAQFGMPLMRARPSTTLHVAAWPEHDMALVSSSGFV
jgi:hypothetical protein